MKLRLSKIFFLKITILIFFMSAAIVVSFILGRSFAGTLMGEITLEERVQSSTEIDQDDDSHYSPLASQRFNYDPDQFPRDRYQTYLTQRPDEEEVLDEMTRVEMTLTGSQRRSDNIFSLDEASDDLADTSIIIPETADHNLIYKVLVKTPGVRENAENMYQRLKTDGYDPLIVATVRESDIEYHVQIAALKNLDRANELAEELRRKNYNAWVKYSRQ